MVRRALMVIRAQLVTNDSEEYACHALVSLFMASARCVIQRSTRVHHYNGLVLRLTTGCILASNCLDQGAFNESRPLPRC